MKNPDLTSFYAFLKTQGFIWGPEPDCGSVQAKFDLLRKSDFPELGFANVPSKSDLRSKSDFPEPDLPYEAIPGHYTYGPLGKLFKNELEKYLRFNFNFQDYHEIETPLIYPRSVWEASGHWNKFQDPVIMDQTGKMYRLDKLIETKFPDLIFSCLNSDQILAYIDQLNNLNSPNQFLKSSISQKNLMMTVMSGSKESALRPETATTTYLTYQNSLRCQGGVLPIRLYQIGKAFRNEISPRQNVLRCREFTQAEAHLIMHEKDKNNYLEFQFISDNEVPILINNQIKLKTVQDCLNENYFNSEAYAWTVWFSFNLVQKILPLDRIRIRKQTTEEKAFYALDACDIEVRLDHFGWTEIAGIHDRGSYDLSQHQLSSDPVPHILEIAFGVDRLLFSLLDIYYDKKEMEQGKSLWKIPYTISPIKMSVFPLLKNKPELIKMAKQVYQILKYHFVVEYDEKQSIGKRYLKSGIKGIPYCVTIDHQSLTDQSVTIRDRDSETQVRIELINLISWFNQKF